MVTRTANIARALWQATVLLSVAFICVSLGFWHFDRTSPVEIISAEPRSASVQRGGALVIDYKSIQRRTCPGVLQRIMVDSQDVLQFLEPQEFHTTRNADRIGDGVIKSSIEVSVPIAAAPGPARYQAIVKYQCNPLQRLLGNSIDIVTPPVEFTIMAGPVAPVIVPGRAQGRWEALTPAALALDGPQPLICAGPEPPSYTGKIGTVIRIARRHCRSG